MVLATYNHMVKTPYEPTIGQIKNVTAKAAFKKNIHLTSYIDTSPIMRNIQMTIMSPKSVTRLLQNWFKYWQTLFNQLDI